MYEFENVERDREANEGLRYDDWWDQRQRQDAPEDEESDDDN